MLDGHSLGATIDHDMKPRPVHGAATSASSDVVSSIESTIRRAPTKDFGRGVLIETVHGIVCRHVAASARQFRHETQMARENRQVEREPFIQRVSFFRPND